MSHDTDAETFLTSEFEEEASVDHAGRDPETTVIPPTRSLAPYLLREFTTAAQRRRIRTATSLSVVIQAPSPAWVVPLGVALRALGAWQMVDLRDGTTRYKRKPDDGDIELAGALAVGMRVVGISHAPDDMLPRSLLSGADMRIAVGQPTDRVVRRVIRSATGSLPRSVPPGIAAGLDLGT